MTYPRAHTNQGGLGIAGIAMLSVVAAGWLSACGSAGISAGQKTAAATSATQTTKPAPPTVAFTVVGHGDGAVVREASLTLRGTVTSGAHVRINGHRATVNGSHWQLPVSLRMGGNDLALLAAKSGYADFAGHISITRHHTAAEAAAIAQAQAAARAQAAQAEAARQAAIEPNFKASTSSVSYADLLKDSGPFMNKAVNFRGQILQIQQSGGSGVMLLSVTDQGSGLWTDNVWVDYNTSTPAVQNDVVTVYGNITGTKSYATQSGGNTYVPQMTARYIDQTG